MTRAEKRRNMKEQERNKTATYNLTRAQLDDMITKEVNKYMAKVKEDVTNEAVNTAMILLLSLPMKVLMDHYWTKTSKNRIPQFTNHILEYYQKWQNGEFDMAEIEKELWEYAGIRLEEGEI